jgi:hypothetical protein
MCSACERSGSGANEALIDLGIPAPNYPNSYLMLCRHCNALWMGNGYTPQYMQELTPAEASEIFPGWEKRVPAV